jgi:LacI family transcriptional regulator
MKATVVNIAKIAGVSPTLVSFVVNNNSKQLARMNAKTVERVQKIAAQLGYHRNELFNAGRSGKSKFLALLARDVNVEHYARVMEQIIAATDILGFSQKLLKLREPEDCPRAATRILEYRVCGGIFLGVRDNMAKAFCENLRQPEFRTMLIGTDPDLVKGGILVTTDEKRAIGEAIEYLRNLGHRRIAYLGPGEEEMTHRVRRNAFVSSARKLGLPLKPMDLISVTWDPKDPAEALVNALRHSSRPTAIVCYSDYAALIALRVAHQLKLHVPRDLSIIGYDDNLFGALMGPALTTFRQDLSVLRDRYVPEFIESIQHGTPLNPKIRRIIPVSLIERESTARAPKL